MYQITNHDPAPPSAANPQVPVMLDYIIAKVLAKAPEARYQSAADFANDLRECKSQLETGQAGAAPVLATTRPIPLASQAAAAPSGQDPRGNRTKKSRRRPRRPRAYRARSIRRKRPSG